MIRQIFGVGLDSLTAEHLKALVDAHEEESQHLEFKSQLPAPESYRDFAKVVSAFANATGGIILLGIKEKNDRAEELCPIPLGKETSRLAKSLNSLIQPRISGLRWRTITVEGDQGFLVLEVPRSYLRPHLVVDGESFSAWRRVEKQPQPLNEADVERLYSERTAALGTAGEAATQLTSSALSLLAPPFLRVTIVPVDVSRRVLEPDRQARQRIIALLNAPVASGFIQYPDEGDSRLRFRRIEATQSLMGAPSARRSFTAVTDTGEVLKCRRFFSWPGGPATVSVPGRGAIVVAEHTSTLSLLDSLCQALVMYRALVRELDFSAELLIRVGASFSGRGVIIHDGPMDDDRPYCEDDFDSQAGLSTDQLFDGASLLLAARALLVDVYSAFGAERVVPISSKGALNLGDLPGAQRQLVKEWAIKQHLPLQ